MGFSVSHVCGLRASAVCIVVIVEGCCDGGVLSTVVLSEGRGAGSIELTGLNLCRGSQCVPT